MAWEGSLFNVSLLLEKKWAHCRRELRNETSDLQSKVIRLLHETHPGVVKMKVLARSYVVHGGQELTVPWKNVVVKNVSRIPVMITLWSFQPDHGREFIFDFAGPFQNFMWLIVVDTFSKWPVEWLPLQKPKLYKNYDQFLHTGGEQIVSDNGPQFTGDVFDDFSGVKELNIPEWLLITPGQTEWLRDLYRLWWRKWLRREEMTTRSWAIFR